MPPAATMQMIAAERRAPVGHLQKVVGAHLAVGRPAASVNRRFQNLRYVVECERTLLPETGRSTPDARLEGCGDSVGQVGS